MTSLLFDKTQLVNLEYSLPKEIILANQHGAYCNTTIVGCNTRKYHGLLVAPVSSIDGGRHVFLNSLHETIIQHEQEFNLGIHKYPGEYNPKGHKYARYFEMDPVTKMVYRVGGVVIQKEMVLLEQEPRLLIRYTLLEAHSPTRIRLKPFMSFRSIHKLSKANMFTNTRVELVKNGIQSKLYSEYPSLFIQTSRKSEFVIAPDWYYNVQYAKEKLRGYEYLEDLFVPGFFEMPIQLGQAIIVSVGLSEASPNQLSRKFNSTVEAISEKTAMRQFLKFSARKFVQNREKGKEIMSGYPWFGRWGRHSFISIPGLTLATGKIELARNILQTMEKFKKGGIFPDHSPDFTKPQFGSADTSLWFVWAVQQVCIDQVDWVKEFKNFSQSVFGIIQAYLNGALEGITVSDNGLVHAYQENKALTWMDSYLDETPVTQRPGYAIEVNALWYNAICFALEGARLLKDKKMIKTLEELPAKLQQSMQQFWDDDKAYLADHIFEGESNWDVRPNQLLAASLPYSAFSDEQIISVLEVVKQELLTTKGIRSLSPRSTDFKQTYEGDHHKRDLAYHQGTVWPWLIGPFAEAWLKLHGKAGRKFIEELLSNFEEDLLEHGIGMISEVHDGSPPHRACGAIAFASSVGELLRIEYLLSKM